MVGVPALGAAPPAPAAKPAKAPAAPPAERLPDIPGYVLIGMGVTGFGIIAVASRRRVSGRSVSS